MTALESPIWQGISGLLALAAIVVSIAIYRLQTQRRSLAYHIVTDSPLISEPKMLSGKVKITFGDTPVGTLRFLVVRFQNTGRAALQRSEFDGPIRLQFSRPSDVLLAVPADLNPSNLPIAISSTHSLVEVAPLLLNPKDSFSIHCVLSSADAELTVEARISGVKSLTHLTVDREGNQRSNAAIVLAKVQVFAIGATLAASLLTSFTATDIIKTVATILFFPVTQFIMR
jgi:hypothetical protein